MTAQRYIAGIVKSYLMPYLTTVQHPTFQQDNAHSYVARVTLDYLAHVEINLIPWPPPSPDLYPTAHVWHMIGGRLNELQKPSQTLVKLEYEVGY
nr:unnamed protein product [Callosobruchus chinensis]